MGREVRRVPPNWEHPKDERGHYKPLYDKPFEDAAKEWKDAYAAWERGERPDYCSGDSANLEYWEWNGEPPDRGYYRPSWTEAEATWFQVYETVSEGTPVSPAFATREELVEYLVKHGDFWAQSRGEGGCSRKAAEAFVMEDGWVPSMVIENGKITTGIESAARG